MKLPKYCLKLFLVWYSTMCYIPPLPSVSNYELNFLHIFIYHQLGKEKHSIESSFVAVIYSIMPQIRQTRDLQLGCTNPFCGLTM